MISSESLAGIEVFKSLTPEQDGDAIGGSVNFVTAKAPVVPRTILNALVGYNVYHDTYDNIKLNGVLSRRVLDGKLGVIASGSYSRIDRSSDNANAGYRFAGLVELENISLSDNTTDRKRLNGSLALDYDLAPGQEIYLSGMYARTDVDNVYRGISLSANTGVGSLFAGRNENEVDLVNVSLGGRHEFGAMRLDWKGNYIRSGDAQPVNFSYGFSDNNPLDGQQIPVDDPFSTVARFRFDSTVLVGGHPQRRGR